MCRDGIGRPVLRSLRQQLSIGPRLKAVELLDSGTLSTDEIEANLDDLARLNRLPGGTRTSIAAIRHLAPDDGDLRIVDVGSGRADMPIAFARRGWPTVAVDANPDVVRIAERATRSEPNVDVVHARAHALPFGDGAFDVAHCSLLLHHLAPDEAAAALRELSRVARRGVVVNDLRRGRGPLAATWLSTMLLARSRVTRNDGLVSARCAYTLDELDALLAEAGLSTRWRSMPIQPRVVTAAS